MSDGVPMTYSWSRLAEHFRSGDSVSTQAIADLCFYIDARPIRSGVHGWQSMYELSIVQLPVWTPDGAHLHIKPFSADAIEFRYIDTHLPTRQWSRRNPADHIVHRFTNTMRQLGWFTDPSMLD